MATGGGHAACRGARSEPVAFGVGGSHALIVRGAFFERAGPLGLYGAALLRCAQTVGARLGACRAFVGERMLDDVEVRIEPAIAGIVGDDANTIANTGTGRKKCREEQRAEMSSHCGCFHQG